MAYNGWLNRATWNIALWVDNDYGSYKMRLDLKPTTPAECENFCADLFGDQTPDGELLSEVDWQEVSEHWKDDYQDD